MKIGDHVWIREKDNDVGKMVLSGPYEINGIRTTEEKDQDQDQDAVRKPYYQYKIYTGNGSHIWYYASDLFVVLSD